MHPLLVLQVPHYPTLCTQILNNLRKPRLAKLVVANTPERPILSNEYREFQKSQQL